jgi:tripartite-type tricarboxylate transporter receptor subunit TctC
MRKKLKTLGVEPASMTTAEMDDLLKRDVAAYKELIGAAGIKP